MHREDENGGGERKMIEINPNLLAHTLKNAGKKKTKKVKEDDELEGMEDFGERKMERKTRIRMNDQLHSNGGIRKTQRFGRKTMLREYRKAQEELLNETGGERLIFSNEDGESKLILNEGGGGGNSGLRVNTRNSGAVDDFTDTVQFMKNLEEEIMERAREGGEERRHNHTVRKKATPTPSYGCMKGGSMPTFRQWAMENRAPGHEGGHRTTQRLGVRYEPSVTGGMPVAGVYSKIIPPMAPVAPVAPMFAMPQVAAPHMMVMGGNENEPMAVLYPPATEEPYRESLVPPLLTPIEKEAQEKARAIHEKMKLQSLLREQEQKEEEEKAKWTSEKRGKRKKTVRRKLHTGKINDRVSILIPNKTIRNRFHNLSQKMHQTSIQDIKKFLLKRGFIKVGTSAPHDILRKMYKDLQMLGGEIQNMNGENIVYNFKANTEVL